MSTGITVAPDATLITIRDEPFDSEDAVRLRAASRIEAATAAGTRIDPNARLTAAMMAVNLVVRDRLGAALATGGLVAVGDGVYEVRRFSVHPDARGVGVGRALLARLEVAADELGAPAVVYETTAALPRFVRFFEAAGYRWIAPFGPYAGSPDSVCLSKVLVPLA